MRTSLLTFLHIAIFQFSLSGQEQNYTDAADKHWHFDLTPYFWASSVNSNKIIGPVSFKQDTRFSEVFANMVYAVPLHFEFGKNRWRVITDVLYVKDELDQSAEYTFFPKLPEKSTVGFSSNYQITKLQVEAFGAYNFRKHSKEHVKCKLDVLVGARFTQQKNLLELKQESILDTLDFFPFSHTEQYIDPLIGASYTLKFHEKWKFYLMGNVGGFSVGSKFTSELLSQISFEAVRFMNVNVGYRWIYTNYDNGKSGIEHYNNKSNEFGPMVSVTFKW
jgi:hypothetical protein